MIAVHSSMSSRNFTSWNKSTGILIDKVVFGRDCKRMTAPSANRAAHGYVFERFPTFTQTFCYREVGELSRQGLPPAVFSVRQPSDEPPQDYAAEVAENVTYLPEDEALTKLIKQWHSEKKIPRAMRHQLMDWPGQLDKHRVYAAAWIGPRLRQAGIRHVHVHFAGIAARTAYWLKKFYRISYSFTGHANDIFRQEEKLPVQLSDLIREAAFVATVSNFSAAELQRQFPENRSKIHAAYNGIALDQWPLRENPPAESSPPQIISVGRLIEKKGFGDLIEACALLQQRGSKFVCKIVGEGPLENQLQEAIDHHGLQQSVILTGPQPQNQIATWIRQSRVFALPCVVEQDGGMDNLPTVIVEAMASGVPCVSTTLAGVPEMIVDGTSGYLVPPGDTKALAASIEQYLGDPQLAVAHGRQGRDLAESRFALPITARHLKHLLVAYGKIFPPLAALRQDRKLLSTWLGGRLRRLIPAAK